MGAIGVFERSKLDAANCFASRIGMPPRRCIQHQCILESIYRSICSLFKAFIYNSSNIVEADPALQEGINGHFIYCI